MSALVGISVVHGGEDVKLTPILLALIATMGCSFFALAVIAYIAHSPTAKGSTHAR